MGLHEQDKNFMRHIGAMRRIATENVRPEMRACVAQEIETAFIAVRSLLSVIATDQESQYQTRARVLLDTSGISELLEGRPHG